MSDDMAEAIYYALKAIFATTSKSSSNPDMQRAEAAFLRAKARKQEPSR